MANKRISELDLSVGLASDDLLVVVDTGTGETQKASLSQALDYIADNLPVGDVTGTGDAGRLALWTGTSVLSYDASLYWDTANELLTVQSATNTGVTSITGQEIGISDTGYTASMLVDPGVTMDINLIVPTGSSLVPAIYVADAASTPVPLALQASQVTVEDFVNVLTLESASVTTDAATLTIGSATAAVNISSAFTLPTVDGSSGNVLTTDGAGNVSWASPGGGGTITGSGTATQIAFFTGASAIGSETAVGSDSFTWDSTNELLGVRTASPSNVVDVQAGALNSGQAALSVTGTLSSTVATQRGITMFITGAGSSTQQIEGVIAGISGGGYTGSGASIGANIYNESLGAGNQPFAQQWGNFAVRGQAYGASATGHNVGFYATAQNALRNFGFVSAQTTSSQANGYNVGIATVAHNAAASGVRVGGYFSVDTTFLPAEPTLTSAALIADNTSTSDPIFLARDNGTTTFSISNNGIVLAKNTSDSTAAFSVQNAAGATILDVDTTNARVGIGTSAPASALDVVGVIAASTGVVAPIQTNAQSASYVLALSDASKIVEVAVSSPSTATVTVPLNSSVAFPVGTQIIVSQTGTGAVSIAGAVGVTIDYRSGLGLNLNGQWAAATLIKRATDTWMLFGDLA